MEKLNYIIPARVAENVACSNQGTVGIALTRLNSNNYDYCYSNKLCKLNLTVVAARMVTRVSRYLAVCARLHRKQIIYNSIASNRSC